MMENLMDYIDISNRANISKFQTLSSTEWIEWKADWLEEKILYAKEQYYSGEPWCSDYIFDYMENHLRKLRPESTVLSKVGS